MVFLSFFFKSLNAALFRQELASLIILDLSGNPVERAENYRIYVLFHLPALKALDGTAVVSTDASHQPKVCSYSDCD